MKKRFFPLLLLTLAVLLLSGCSKDEMLRQYDRALQCIGDAVLTHGDSLTGKRIFGAEHYTGTYTADYRRTTTTEYLFGGTGLSRGGSQELTVTCTLTCENGSARVFYQSGSDDPVTLLETDGSYSGTLTVPAGSNYLGVICDGFTGRLELRVASEDASTIAFPRQACSKPSP